MELPIISEEQKIIINNIKTKNVIVDAIAGSGKTTTNLHLAKYYYNQNILLLTYNAKLKIETREKAKLLGISNLEVHSYHSFCVKYYNHTCFTDSGITKIIKENTAPIKNFSYNIIILDEAQDIHSLYFELICKIYLDNVDNVDNVDNIDNETKICIFGDKKQSIYDFNNADSRYIELADKIFILNNLEWVKCNLSISFRITNTMADFVNKCILRENRLKANKISKYKPRYIICDCFYYNNSDKMRTYTELKYYLNMGYKPDEIFIIAPSIKSEKSPVRLLENVIKRNMKNINIFVPISDDEKLDQDVLNGKLVFSTYHQVKGLERKVVIVFNFDNSYFDFYKKNAIRTFCPNELYVALTRSKEHITIFHHRGNKYLEFINSDILSNYCYVENKLLNAEDVRSSKPKSVGVTELLRYLPENIIDNCLEYISIEKNKDFITEEIKIPTKTTNNETKENINEINGIIIPILYEYKLTKRITILELFHKLSYTNKIKEYNILKFNFNKIEIKTLTISDLLYICNCWLSCSSGYLFKICQIQKYDWLSDDLAIELVLRMCELKISNTSLFEYEINSYKEPELNGYHLCGSIDCIDNDKNIIYEFKCVNHIEKQHYLQLALYMYLYETYKLRNGIINNNTKYVIFNIIKNDYYEIKSDLYKLRKMVNYIIFNKYENIKKITDDIFIKNNKIILQKYINFY